MAGTTGTAAEAEMIPRRNHLPEWWSVVGEKLARILWTSPGLFVDVQGYSSQGRPSYSGGGAPYLMSEGPRSPRRGLGREGGRGEWAVVTLAGESCRENCEFCRATQDCTGRSWPRSVASCCEGVVGCSDGGRGLGWGFPRRLRLPPLAASRTEKVRWRTLAD